MNKKEEIMAFPSDFGKINRFGMTLRDYFAAKAMQALIGKMDENFVRQQDYYKHFGLVENSFSIADEMLKQREL